MSESRRTRVFLLRRPTSIVTSLYTPQCPSQSFPKPSRCPSSPISASSRVTAWAKARHLEARWRGKGPAGAARPLHVRFVFAPHYQSTGGIAGMARPTAWPSGVEHPDRKRRERERCSGTLWVSPPRGAGNRFIAAFFPVSGIRELSGAGLNEVGPSACLSCAWPITPPSFSTI